MMRIIGIGSASVVYHGHASAFALPIGGHGRTSSDFFPSPVSSPLLVQSRTLPANPLSTCKHRSSSTNVSMSLAAGNAATKSVLAIPRAGGSQTSLASSISESISNAAASATSNPIVLFDSLLIVLAIGAVGFKTFDRFTTNTGGGGGDGDGVSDSRSTDAKEEKPAQVKSMQAQFFLAFWLLRCGYWMSGPYVVPAYKSKVFGGVEASMALVSRIFLTGFAATAIVS